MEAATFLRSQHIRVFVEDTLKGEIPADFATENQLEFYTFSDGNFKGSSKKESNMTRLVDFIVTLGEMGR